MRLAAISDLHLSPPGPSCAFTHSADAFLRFLDRLEDTHDAILLIGDVYDLDVGERFLDRDGELARARDAWSPILDRLDQPHVLWVHGNHDALIAQEGVPTERRLAPDGWRILLRHGHRFGLQPWVEPFKPPVKWVAGRSQRRGGWLGDALYRANDLLTQAPAEDARRARPSATTRGAHRLLKQDDSVDVLICGHDHIPRVDHTPHGVYANSGTCGYGRLDYLSLNTDARHIHIGSGMA